MIIRKFAACAAMVAFAAQPVVAGGPIFLLQPVPVGAETIRFQQGIPTVDLQMPDGVVQITPLPIDHGSLAFSVAVYNDGKVPANIDVTSFAIAAGPQKIAVFSREQLESKSKKRAMWASIAIAAAGGLAAAAAASQRDTYTNTLYTPRGTYRSVFTAPSQAGQVAAAASIAGAGVGIAAIQNQLDHTRQALGDTTVQMTTVDPGDSYAGRIVLEKIKSNVLPQPIAITVNWNGRAYPFAFQLAKKGTPQPVFPITVPTEAPTAAALPVGAVPVSAAPVSLIQSPSGAKPSI